MVAKKTTDKEVKKSTPVKKVASKVDKASFEEISKKKEEVLRRIDAEIGKSEESAASQKEEEIEEIEEEPETASEDMIDNAEDGNKDEAVDDKAELAEDVDLKEEMKADTVEGEKEESEMGKKASEDKEEMEKEAETEPAEEEAVKKEEKGPFSATEFGINDNSKGKKFTNIILFVIVFIVVALVSAGFYFYNVGNIFSPKAENTEEVIPTSTPTPTPEPTFNREEVAVQILNGSGTAGVAGAAEKVLADKGYTNIEVGNAEEFDYENVTIQLKSGYVDYFDDIKKDLEDDYVVNDSYDELDEDSDFDIVVIVGTEVDDSEE